MGTVKKPILIKNFLNKEELRLLNTYFKIRHRANLIGTQGYDPYNFNNGLLSK